MVHALELADAGVDGARVAHSLDDVAGPRLALGADHRRTFGDAPRGLAKVAAAAHERHLERVLVDVVLLVRRRQHLRLVDVVDAKRFEHLRLDEVADAALGHDGDGDRGHDRLDQVGVRHARDAAFLADVGGDALERHHGARARLLGDTRVLGRDDVHDHAALQHLGEPGLDLERALHRPVAITNTVAFGHDRNSTRAPGRLPWNLADV